MHKLKSIIHTYRRELVLATLFFIISSFSFGLGVLFAREHTVTPIIIEQVARE